MAKSHTIHFVDTETTGLIDLNAAAEIIEIAVVKWCDGEQETLLHEYVIPRVEPDENARKINNYDELRWIERGAIRHWDLDCTNEMHRVLEGAFLGGSNPAFDMAMIRAECYRTGQPAPNWSHRKLDTSSLGYPLWVMGEVEKTGLVQLAQYFGVVHETAHTALGDCKAAIGVWEAFFDLYIYRPRMMREFCEHVRQTEPIGSKLMYAARAALDE